MLTSVANVCHGVVPLQLKTYSHWKEQLDHVVNATMFQSFGKAYNATTNIHSLKEHALYKSPSKYISRLKRSTKSPLDARQDWGEEMRNREEFCKNGTSGGVCAYAWMVGSMTGIEKPEQLIRMLEKNLVQQNGWEAAGLPVEKPQTGYFASFQGATFWLSIPVKSDIHFMTVLSLVSYGPSFIGTNLKLTVTIFESPNDSKNHTNGPMVAKAENVYDISGFHETKTSIDVPHKFKLAGGGAKSGDTIEVFGNLTSGSHFKISGLAFCIL